MAGKGSKPRPVDMSKAVIYCEHGRFKDLCDKCKIVRKMEDKVYQVSINIPVEKCKCGGELRFVVNSIVPCKSYKQCKKCKKRVKE